MKFMHSQSLLYMLFLSLVPSTVLGIKNSVQENFDFWFVGKWIANYLSSSFGLG